MMSHPKQNGFTLVELLLFLGLAAIMGGTLVSVYIATQESRVRQQGIAGVEQRGTQILELIGTNVRRAEAVLDPTAGNTGSVLALQMGLNVEFPTIIGTASGTFVLIQKTLSSALIPMNITVDAFEIRNIEGKSVRFSFTLTAHIASVPPSTYSKEFSGSATLYPDDQSDAGGCGSCAAPTCVDGLYTWRHCVSDTCTAASTKLSCE